jgi:putative redox protein
VKVRARRRQGLTHEVEVEGGHRLTVDEPVEVGGADAGPGPTELLSMSLASCTAITMQMYAARKEWELGDVEVAVEVSYEGLAPSSYVVSFRLPSALSDEQRERMVVVAHKCPVHKVIAAQMPVVVTDLGGGA